MKLKFYSFTLFTSVLAILISTTQVSSKKSSPPAGNCGDPTTNNTCGKSGCHSVSAFADPQRFDIKIGTGSPTTPLNSSFHYVPGTQYNIAFLYDNSSTLQIFGFQMCALTGSNTQAGSFTVTNTTNTSSIQPGAIQYIGHKTANSTKNWAFKWTAPSTPMDVSFYYCGVSGNNMDNASGDLVYKGTTTITAQTNSVSELNSVSDFVLYPNPVQNQLNVRFNLSNDEDLNVSLVTLEGRVISEQQLFASSNGEKNMQFNTADLSSGMYFVKISNGTQTQVQKFFKN